LSPKEGIRIEIMNAKKLIKMKNIKYVIILLSLCVLSQNAWSQNEINVPLSNAGARGTLEVDTHRGKVTVKGSNRQDVLVRYMVKGKSELGLEDAGNGLKRISGGRNIGLEITEDDNEISIETEHNSKVDHIIVEIPTNFDLEINTHHNGAVIVDNIEGEVVIDTHHGGVEATNISGSVVADSWHGNIIVTYNKMTENKSQAFTTYHGKIDLTLPASSKSDLKLKSTRGEILTGFDISLKKRDNQRKKTDEGYFKVIIDDWVTGTINGGGAEIKAETRGNIYIRKA